MAMAAKGRFLPQLVSDGIDANHSSNFLKEMVEDSSSSSSSENCEQMYGFLPCSNSIYGHLFLILVYEYLLFRGESYLAHGGEQIFKILGPGFFGASAFQVICALPESLILLASGLLSTKEDAQEYAYTGVGLLAGSSILLLTIVWGTCLIVARQNLHHGAEYSILDANANSASSFSFQKLLHYSKRNGITTDQETTYTARIMVFSVIPFIIIQVLDFFTSSSAEQPVILITLTISVVFLLSYFFYQCFQPWIQQRKLEFVKHEYLVLKVLQHVQKRALTRILTYNGAPNINAIRRLFEKIDSDGDNWISQQELREVIMDVKFGKVPWNADEVVAKVIEELDARGDKRIDEEEFINGISRWLKTSQNEVPPSPTPSIETEDDIFQKTWEETDKLVDEGSINGGVVASEWTWIKAIMKMGIGFIILAVLAEPLIYSVHSFSKAANLPSFFISFILVPLTTNARAAISAIKAAWHKKPRTTSLTFSEIYGGVFMNNILGFAVLLALVYMRGLTWEFSGEVLVLLIVCGVMGVIASIRSTFPLWMSFLAFLLYPLSLLLVYAVDFIL
ncbi:Calcium-binding EF-hand [Corchorus capsularis]|uniref:Calcium-binding EF-hand n=1 Tax=Corchorus capsularis TaxID=210143 RepID=A0A1R3HWW9_COCAP|nr:Calcium-binding EF-hand [Corchorus capsularis]